MEAEIILRTYEERVENKKLFENLWRIIYKHGVEYPHIGYDHKHKILSFKNIDIKIVVTRPTLFISLRRGLSHYIEMDKQCGRTQIKSNLSDPKQFLTQLINDLNEYFIKNG